MTGATLLAIHPGALGDVVLFGHLLSALDGRETLVAGGEKARLLTGLGVVGAALDFDSLPMHEVFSDTPVSECRLPKPLGRHDRLVSCFAGGDARAERRLMELCGAAEAAFLPTRPPAGFDGHLTECWAQLLGRVGSVSAGCWSAPAQWIGQAAQALCGLGLDSAQPYAVIHPGAGAEEKCWPLDRFLGVGKILKKKGIQVLFVLGPVELDRWRDGRIDRLRRNGPVLSAPSLTTLAGLLAEAAAYVGNDSGTSHLSAAVGTRTIAVFGPTSPVHFRPLGRSVTAVGGGRGVWVGEETVLRALFD